MSADPMAVPVPGRRPGRPRSASADRAIMRATLELLAEVGFGRLSVEGVAARAGVGKTTIYRRWPSKVNLVLAAVSGLVQQTIPIPDTGSTREDLLILVRSVIDTLSETIGGRILAHLVAETPVNAELADALRRLWGSRRALTFEVLRRGVARGDLPHDVDVEFMADLLYGPIYSRFFVTGAPLNEPVARQIVDALMRVKPGDARVQRLPEPRPSTGRTS